MAIRVLGGAASYATKPRATPARPKIRRRCSRIADDRADDRGGFSFTPASPIAQARPRGRLRRRTRKGEVGPVTNHGLKHECRRLGRLPAGGWTRTPTDVFDARDDAGARRCPPPRCSSTTTGPSRRGSPRKVLRARRGAEREPCAGPLVPWYRVYAVERTTLTIIKAAVRALDRDPDVAMRSSSSSVGRQSSPSARRPRIRRRQIDLAGTAVGLVEDADARAFKDVRGLRRDCVAVCAGSGELRAATRVQPATILCLRGRRCGGVDPTRTERHSASPRTPTAEQCGPPATSLMPTSARPCGHSRLGAVLRRLRAVVVEAAQAQRGSRARRRRRRSADAKGHGPAGGTCRQQGGERRRGRRRTKVVNENVKSWACRPTQTAAA